MDDIVRAALLKWPQVPHCFGWLALDARGEWFLRDEAAQAAGAFPRIKGSRIQHEGLRDYIHRNYEHDAQGCWFFQNGPQRVYVDLEATPWVWRVDRDANSEIAPWRISSHSGHAAQYRSAWLDEQGRLFLDCDIGFGLVHTLDVALAAQAVEAGTWQPREMPFADMPGRFAYRLRPMPGTGLDGPP
jgi:hypothetical protein